MFQDVGDEEIKTISSFVRKKSSLIKNHQKKPDMFGELYAMHPNLFEFRPGDILLIKKLASYVKTKIEIDGLDHFVQNKDKKLQESNQTFQQLGNQSTKTHYFLHKLLSTADENVKREKSGYRYGRDIQYFASYLRMLVGPYAYETLQKNLSYSLPSITSTNRYIRSSGCNITEGILRSEELLLYLTERSLEPVVCVSEDATRITGRVQYDSKTNQLIGFVLPLNNETGMPIPFAFPARDSDEILWHFSKNNPVSSFLNVIMAQPMSNVPAFCLMIYGSDNKYTSLNVANRWEFIKKELAKVNIRVLTFNSDSDPKYNKAMRTLSGLGIQSDNILFSCAGNADGPFYFQDPIHIATKLRNFLLRTIYDKRTIPFGSGFIRIEHLYTLMNMFSKDRHQLTPSTLNPVDRQNFKSVLRICDSRVTDLLNDHVDGSQATIIFLQILRDLIDCFMDQNLTPLQRLRKIWYSLFLVRIWRQFILSSKEYTLKNNFLSVNCYTCIELNAHSLVCCMLYLNQINQPELFKPNLFQSQTCENTFRQLRSMSSVYSTVTNCTVKEAISRLSSIQYQNHIIKLTGEKFVYPRAMENIFVKSDTKLPSKNEIFNEIKFCQSLAITTARKLGLIKPRKCNNLNFACKIKPSELVSKTKLKRVVPISNDSEFDAIQLTSDDLKNIQLKNYAAKVNPNDIDTTGPYVQIICSDNKQMVVKKTSLCWLLSIESKKLSSDRLLRVMQSISKERKRNRRRPLMYPKNIIKKKKKHH